MKRTYSFSNGAKYIIYDRNVSEKEIFLKLLINFLTLCLWILTASLLFSTINVSFENTRYVVSICSSIAVISSILIICLIIKSICFDRKKEIFVDNILKIIHHQQANTLLTIEDTYTLLRIFEDFLCDKKMNTQYSHRQDEQDSIFSNLIFHKTQLLRQNQIIK